MTSSSESSTVRFSLDPAVLGSAFWGSSMAADVIDIFRGGTNIMSMRHWSLLNLAGGCLGETAASRRCASIARLL
eukprot:5658290-Pyramimonas_sp.AAC.1